MLNILPFLVIFSSLVYGYLKNPFGYWKRRGVVFEKPIFPYGNTKELGKNVHPSRFFKNLYDKYKSTGAKICGAYFFISPWAILLDRQVIRNVLLEDFDKFNERGSYLRKFLPKLYKKISFDRYK